MKDKLLLATMTIAFFFGAMLALRYNNQELFLFASGLTNLALGALLLAIRGDSTILPITK